MVVGHFLGKKTEAGSQQLGRVPEFTHIGPRCAHSLGFDMGGSCAEGVHPGPTPRGSSLPGTPTPTGDRARGLCPSFQTQHLVPRQEGGVQG